MSLKQILDSATPGPWEHRVWGHDTDEWPDNRVSVGRVTGHGEAVVINPRYGERTQDLANARLIALAPELAALVLDMGEYMRLGAYRAPEFNWEEEATCRVCASPVSKGHNEVCQLGALLARLDRLGKEQT